MISPFPASEEAIILNFVYKVVTSLDKSDFLFGRANMATDSIAKIKEEILSVLLE
jgi:hypothetical protein